MLTTLLKPCHARLTARCWHRHGRLAWIGGPAHLRFSDVPHKTRKQTKLACRSIATTCTATEQQQVGTDQNASQLLESGMSWRGRSIGCGNLRESHIGQDVTICGWVHRHRSFGGKLFCDVRDSTGIVQVLPVKHLLHTQAPFVSNIGCS